VAATLFDELAELFARDVDRTLLARSLARTVPERLRWLEEMQELAEKMRGRADEAPGAPRQAR
jgi:hypothetical protein